MTKFTIITTVAATALSAAALTLTATAVAAPSGPSSVEQTINQLKAGGYTVIVNKVGAAPTEQCTVAAVRPGQTYSRTDSGTPGAQDDMYTTVTGRTVYVDIAC
jgi:NADPH:quinone reductase-like Zn-dependent oxidoreductase